MRSRMSCVRWGFTVVSLILISLVSFASPAAGQGGDASIVGQVTDQSGAVLPGVTVTATSPALQVPQVSITTNEVGEYRLSPLPIGQYSVLYELTGFRSIRRDEVRLTAGFTAKMDIAMGIASVGEEVTVSGVAPVVDVASTSGTTMLTQEVLEITPTARNGVASILTLTPGVRTFIDVGGSEIAENPTATAFGQSGEVVLHPGRGRDHGSLPRVLGLQHPRRSARPDARHRCGVPDPRRAAQRRGEVGGERVPRHGQLELQQQGPAERQHHARARGAGDRGRQRARESVPTWAATWAAASSGTSCGSTRPRAIATPEVFDPEHLQATGSPARSTRSRRRFSPTRSPGR